MHASENHAHAFVYILYSHDSEIWKRLAPATLKNLGNWIIHLLLRFEQYSDWINTGEPAVMWLSGLHIPESYLTALVQATCRKNSWPLDKSTLFTSVTHYMTPEELNERAHSGKNGDLVKRGRSCGQAQILRIHKRGLLRVKTQLLCFLDSLSLIKKSPLFLYRVFCQGSIPRRCWMEQ